MKVLWISVCSCCVALSMSAQEDGLGELNAAFGGRVKFDVDEDRLIVDHFNGSGHYRQDAAYIDHLDPKSIAWSAEENAILLRCLAAQDQCIDKEIFKLNTIRPTGRMVLPFEGDASLREKAMSELGTWIAAEQARVSNGASETHARPKRKK